MSPSVERLALFVLVTFFILPAHASTIDPGHVGWDQSSCLMSPCLSPSSPHFDVVEKGAFAGLLSSTNRVPVILARCTERIYTCGVMPFGSSTAKIGLTFDSRTTAPGSPVGAILGCLNADCPHWPAAPDAEAASTGVPEPGTIILFVTGVAVLLTCHKLQRFSEF